MPRLQPYSDDLRCALWHMRYAAGMSVTDIVSSTGLAKRTVQRIFSQYANTGTILRTPQDPQSRVRSTLNAEDLSYLQSYLRRTPDAYLVELKQQLEDNAGVSVSISTLWRALQRMGYTLKKVSKIALERSEAARNSYIYRIGSTYEARQLVFGDESSFDRRTTYRPYAWALKGRRAYRKVFFVRGKRYSILPALSLDGILFCDIVEGSFTAARFLEFVRGLLDKMQPYPGPNSVLVLDNCSIHKAPEIRELIESRGMRLEFLPPYSPDFNPIEEGFSALKARLRRNYPHFAYSAATGTTNIDRTEVLCMLYNTVYSLTAEDAAGFFHHSGYI